MNEPIDEEEFESRRVMAHAVRPYIMGDEPDADLAIGLLLVHEGEDGSNGRTAMLCDLAAAAKIAHAILELLAARADTQMVVPAICQSLLVTMGCDRELIEGIEAFRLARKARLEATEKDTASTPVDLEAVADAIEKMFGASVEMGQAEPDLNAISDVLAEQFPGLTMADLQGAALIFRRRFK